MVPVLMFLQDLGLDFILQYTNTSGVVRRAISHFSRKIATEFEGSTLGKETDSLVQSNVSKGRSSLTFSRRQTETRFGWSGA
jgi:hypothetical protein